MGRLFEAICHGEGMNHERFWAVMDYAREHYVMGHTALEVGSDDGAYALGFSLLGYEVMALDPARTPFMAHLYHYMPVRLERAPINPSPGYQLVHIGEVIEHAKDPAKILARACELCHPDGHLIVSAPNFMAGGHLRTYNKEEFEEFVGPYFDKYDRFRSIESLKNPGKFHWLAMGRPK